LLVGAPCCRCDRKENRDKHTLDSAQSHSSPQ
jgi:hypothetical protein